MCQNLSRVFVSGSRGLGYVTHVSFAKNCHARKVGWQNLECMHSAYSSLATSANWEHRENKEPRETIYYFGAIIHVMMLWTILRPLSM